MCATLGEMQRKFDGSGEILHLALGMSGVITLDEHWMTVKVNSKALGVSSRRLECLRVGQ